MDLKKAFHHIFQIQQSQKLADLGIDNNFIK